MLDKINNNISTFSQYKQKTNNKNQFSDELNPKKENTSYSTELTFQNIKSMSLEKINNVFSNEDDKKMAENLKLATLFTEDEVLGQALFNTVLGKPFDLGFSILSNRYNDKHIFLNNKESSFTSLLHDVITIENKGEKISQNKIDEILLKTQSISFLDSLYTNSKDQYNKYKDDDKGDYSFLYNDYSLQYQELLSEYKNIKNFNNNIISQF